MTTCKNYTHKECHMVVDSTKQFVMYQAGWYLKPFKSLNYVYWCQNKTTATRKCQNILRFVILLSINTLKLLGFSYFPHSERINYYNLIKININIFQSQQVKCGLSSNLTHLGAMNCLLGNQIRNVTFLSFICWVVKTLHANHVVVREQKHFLKSRGSLKGGEGVGGWFVIWLIYFFILAHHKFWFIYTSKIYPFCICLTIFVFKFDYSICLCKLPSSQKLICLKLIPGHKYT